MLRWYVRFQLWLRSERGQALSEYGVVIALILVATITAIQAFSGELQNLFQRLKESLIPKQPG